MPLEDSAAGLTVSESVEAIRILSYALSASRSINLEMVCSKITESGTQEQEAEWLPRLGLGEIACFV